MKNRRVFINLILIFIVASCFQVFADKSAYEIVREMWLEGKENITIENRTTYDEAVKANAEIVDTFDAITTGATPKITTTIAWDEGKVKTSSWSVQVKAADISALDTDVRIITELEAIEAQSTFYDKVYEINEFVKSCAEYDRDYTKGNSSETALGCLNGKAICQGYANLASYLYDKAGIDNIKVRGIDKTKNQRHVWNVVRDPEGKFYVVDSTWSLFMVSLENYRQLADSELDIPKLFCLKYSISGQELLILLKYFVYN